MMITLRATLPLLSYSLPRASRTPVSAWLLPDIIFRIFNTAICVPYSNHSLSIAANLGLWQELQWLPLLPKFCPHTHMLSTVFQENSVMTSSAASPLLGGIS